MAAGRASGPCADKANHRLHFSHLSSLAWRRKSIATKKSSNWLSASTARPSTGLEHHHAGAVSQAAADLNADERPNAIWKLSGQSLALTRAYVDLLKDGYTAQTWPTMRAIHEANRLLGAVADPDEDGIVRRWLADQEIKQAEARLSNDSKPGYPSKWPLPALSH